MPLRLLKAASIHQKQPPANVACCNALVKIIPFLINSVGLTDRLKYQFIALVYVYGD